MYEMKVKTPPMSGGKQRRSWTGRLKDRFKTQAVRPSDMVADEWTWDEVEPVHHHHHLPPTSHHNLFHEGNHAPSVPSLQGSVFVAANFVYDYRQKYGLADPSALASGWITPHQQASVAVRRSSDWTTTRALYPLPGNSPVFQHHHHHQHHPLLNRSDSGRNNAEFRAADVNQNLRQLRQHKREKSRTPSASPSFAASNVAVMMPVDGDTFESEDDDEHPQTTVAVDRPGLIVSGQRICILTHGHQNEQRVEHIDSSEDPDEDGSTGESSPRVDPAEKVSLRVEFQRSCPLRRSLSDRAAPKMANIVNFHDTTRLTVKSRSRGSLHDLLQHQQQQQQNSSIKESTFRRALSRPTEPPPPPPSEPPPPIPPAGSSHVEETPPVKPPRRVYRHSKSVGNNPTVKISTESSSISPGPATAPVPSTTSEADLTPGVTAWVGRPLTGQMVSWTAWTGQHPHPATASPTSPKAGSPTSPYASTPVALAHNPEQVKRRPVSRLWPSFSTIGRSNNSAQQAQNGQQEEHIYEEIDDSQQPNGNDVPAAAVGFNRTSRGGSFAGASRQDILRYLDELRKKHPTGIISAEVERTKSPSTLMTPSLPQLISSSANGQPAADEEEDDDMGALLLAMRHNATRNSNRSTQSSTASTQSGGQESTESSGSSSASASALLLTTPGCYQSGGEIERNDSGVGSETSGTAQRLRRMKRLKQQQQQQQQVEDTATTPWCVDCDQPIVQETDQQEDHDSLVCHRCARRRCERREVLAELLETEVRYGRDLRVLQDELYKPLLVAGLVPVRQLDAVFLNVAELSAQSGRFGQRLREAVEIALEQGDEDLLTVDVARLFLDKETEKMMDAFRRYCVRSGEASLLLSTLEKERELLRIFLRASQLENPALRRMDLHAFLMVPVQRITKYPLLLGRLLRATAQQDVEMREALREAQAKVESYLTAINSEAKELGNVSRPWRRNYSVPNLNLSLGTIQRPSGEELMTLRLRKVAMDNLNWSDGVTQFVFEGQVKLTQPSDLLLTTTRSRGRTLKWQSVWIALITLNPSDCQATEAAGQADSNDPACLNFGSKSKVQEAAIVFVKDAKAPRPGPSLYREPLMMSQCTISCEAELPTFFEVHHIVSKESFICQVSDAGLAQQWLHKLRTLSLSLGQWKKRRNALPQLFMMNN